MDLTQWTNWNNISSSILSIITASRNINNWNQMIELMKAEVAKKKKDFCLMEAEAVLTYVISWESRSSWRKILKFGSRSGCYWKKIRFWNFFFLQNGSESSSAIKIYRFQNAGFFKALWSRTMKNRLLTHSWACKKVNDQIPVFLVFFLFCTAAQLVL